jgi:hypothetical protein
MVSLVNVMEDGGTVEVGVFGREGVLGLLSALVTREAFGRYIVQMSGTASRIQFERLDEIRNACPGLRQLLMRYGEALLAQTFQTVSCNAVHAAEARCCRWILSMHDRADQDTLPLTHEFLGEMLGVATLHGERGDTHAPDSRADRAEPRGHHRDRPGWSRRDGLRMLRPHPADLPASAARHVPANSTSLEATVAAEF